MINGQGFAMGIIDAVGNTTLMYLHGAKVGPWMQTMHFCFGVGAFIAPLLVRSAQHNSSSGSDYSASFYFFSVSLLLPAVILAFLKSSEVPIKPTKEKSSIKRCSNEMLVIVMASASLGIYVGAETGFGAFILVYSKWNNNFSEASG